MNTLSRGSTALRLLFCLFGFVLCLAGIPLTGSASEIRVFAAISLADSLKEIAADFQKESGHKVIFNFGASSLLQQQIEAGAPADIFFSADEAKMDALAKKGLLDASTRKSRLSNTLVIVVAAENGADLQSPNDLASAKVTRLALADPRAVPAGIYARQYLEQQNLWDTVKPKIIPTENVRAALAAVESGNVEAAIVYKTDAKISARVRIAFEIPASAGPHISYPMALVKDAGEQVAARRFLDYLASPKAGAVFRKFGLLVLD
jgi:molybdate transport system substrate-binding protein